MRLDYDRVLCVKALSIVECYLDEYYKNAELWNICRELKREISHSNNIEDTFNEYRKKLEELNNE